MSERTDQVDKIFAEWDRPGSPGCSLAVIKDGDILYKKGYGLANLEYGTPNTPRTIYHVASVSKQFTAWAITHLASLGKLSLDDDIHRYLPEVPDFGEPITLRHLLHHTSGLRDQWELLILAGWRMDDVITVEDILDVVGKQKELNFKPGSEYTYCNTGYTLLGLIVKQVSGKSLREYCEEHLFRPLGMKDTHFHDDYQMIVPNRAYSYQPGEKDGFKHAVLSYSNAGATSLFTTVEDLARWDQNFYTGKAGGIAVIEQLHCQGFLNNGKMIDYAFGIVVGKYRGLRTVEHSGADAGYRSVIVRFPQQHFSVIILSNLSTITPALLARRVADIYLQDCFTEPAPPEVHAIDLPAHELEKFAGVYTNEKSHMTFQLKYRNRKLFVTLDKEYVLYAVGPSKLGITGLKGIVLDFEYSKDQQIEGFFFGDRGDSSEFYMCVPPTGYSKTELKKFCGTYYSPELDTCYQVTMADSKLHLTRRKYGSKELQALTPDKFTLEMIDLKFTRDANNNPTGFLVSTGRVRDLRFERRTSSL